MKSQWLQSQLILDQIESAIRDYGTDIDKEDVLRLSVTNLLQTGSIGDALTRQSSLINFLDERQDRLDTDRLNLYRVQYEVNKLTTKVRASSDRLRSMWRWIWTAVVIAIMCIVVYTVWQRRQKRIYKSVVNQNLEYMKNIADLKNEITKLRDCTKDSCDEDLQYGANIADSKLEDIWNRIVNKMENEKIWTNPQITRETFADEVGTNRTYLSKVIQLKSGMSYSQFMNYRRVQEAMRRLADSSDTTRLSDMSTQLGFLTRGTFHSAFKQVTGISPSAFRLTAKELD